MQPAVQDDMGRAQLRKRPAAAQVAKRPSASVKLASTSQGKRRSRMTPARMKSLRSAWSIAAAKLGPDAPAGPRNRLEVMTILERICADLEPAQRASVAAKFSPGIQLLTDYSGTGQAEQVFQRLFGACGGEQPGLKLDCARASDIKHQARLAISSMSHPPSCILGDLVRRQERNFRKQLRKLTTKCQAMMNPPSQSCPDTPARQGSRKAKARLAWLNGVKKLIEETERCATMGHCYRHCKKCPAVPGLPGQDWLRVVIAGISCLDWSSRGKRGQTLGAGALAWASFVAEIWRSRPDLIVIECTRNYNHLDLMFLLGSIYSMSPLVFSPTSIGIPSERYRKYMVLVALGGRLQWLEGRELNATAFMSLFGRTLMTDAHIYLNGTPQHYVEAYKTAMAKHRGFPSSANDIEELTFQDLLPPNARRRVGEWCGKLAERGLEEGSPLLFDASQNVAFGTITSSMPAITTKNMPWSFQLQRPVVPVEKMEAQGFPAILPELTLGLEKPFDFDVFSSNELSALVGNSMNFGALAVVVLYALIFTCKIE